MLNKLIVQYSLGYYPCTDYLKYMHDTEKLWLKCIAPESYFSFISPDVKKEIQEVYGLINYGVLRKKIKGGILRNKINFTFGVIQSAWFSSVLVEMIFVPELAVKIMT